MNCPWMIENGLAQLFSRIAVGNSSTRALSTPYGDLHFGVKRERRVRVIAPIKINKSANLTMETPASFSLNIGGGESDIAP